MADNTVSIGVVADTKKAELAFTNLGSKVRAETDKIGGHFDGLGDKLIRRFHRRDIRELGNTISNSIMNLATGGSVGDVVAAAFLSMGVGLASSLVVGFAQKIVDSAFVQAALSAIGAIVGPVLAAASTIGTTIGTVISTAAAVAMAIWPALLVAAIVAGIVFLFNNPEIVNNILKFAGEVLANLGRGLARLGKMLGDLFGMAWQLVVDAVKWYVQQVVNFWLGLPGFIASLPGKIADVFRTAFNWVLSIVKGIVGHVIDVIKGIIQHVKDALAWLAKLPNALRGKNVGHDPIGDFLFGTNMPSSIQMPSSLQMPTQKTTQAPTGGGGSSGFMIQGVSEKDIVDMVDRGLFFRLRRAAATPTRV